MSEIRVNRIVNAAGSGAPQFPSGFSLATGMGITNSPNITGAAVTFSGLSQVTDATDSTSTTTGSLVVTGGVGIAKNVYIGAGLSVAGTLTYEDVTSVDSVGLITAKSGVNVTGGQLQVGVAYSVGAAGVCTAAGFVGNISGGTVAGSTGTFTGDVDIADKIVHTGDTNTALRFPAADTVSVETGGTEVLRITGVGATSVGISTVQDFSSYGMLRERVEIVANKLSANTNVNIENGNVYYYTTNETTTATPNIRYSSSQTLNNSMLIGETVAVTIISKPNGAGYYAQMTVDGSAQTEEWNGGAAPSTANAGGYDVNCYQITKTADATFLVLVNTANYA